MSDPGIYTIGWICAITTEFVAAKAFLDEQHDAPLSIAQHDNNSYSLGRMGKHNVVIAALPKSEYGTTAAATVARDMVHSFPNLKVGLMVGIGGGAPRKTHDIRLGDIVVGTRDINTGKGGVVQYDYGKTIQDQEFSMTGSLNQPPQSLLTAISSLEARHMMEGHEINGQIEKALEKYPRLKRSHRRPPVSSDRLYLPHITHPQTDLPGDCSIVCGGDQSRMVMRAERGVEDDNPAVYYGLIASGNRLMKDANVRDQLSGQTGALCFEMEVAGLMNHFPCLVIRGICDYSDTHKNKEWQGFAAMTAAAYTRDLLEEVSAAVVHREDKLAMAIKSLETSQSWQKTCIQETSRIASDIRTSQRHNDLRKWLSPPNSSTNADNARVVRQEGTGSWIFDEPSFQLWRSGFCRHIWLYGPSGCGKTVLSTTIFDRLKKENVQHLLQFYFDFRDPKKQTLDAMLRGLLYQLHLSINGSVSGLDALFSECFGDYTQPALEKLSSCFQDMLRSVESAVILVDALDECATRYPLIRWIKKLVVTSDLGHVKMVVTSRPEYEFKHELSTILGPENCVPLSKSAINSDIRSYVEQRLDNDAGFEKWVTHSEIINLMCDQIASKADGMFRLAACQLDSLENCLDRESIEAELECLPRDLQETYQRILNNIPKTLKPKANRLLQFLLYSKTPITLEKAVDIVAIRRESFDVADRMPHHEEIQRICPSLVMSVATGKGRNRTVHLQLAHSSVQEFLLGHEDVGSQPAASINLTHSCLAYLKGITLHEASRRTETLGKRKRKEQQGGGEEPNFHLAFHAAMSWMDYAKQADEEKCAELITAAASFLLDQDCYTTWHRQYWPTENVQHEGGPLYFACKHGLGNLVKELIGRGEDVNTHSRNGPAIVAASLSGHTAIVKLLVKEGAEVDARSQYWGQTSLQAACRNNHKAVADFLLEAGADWRVWDQQVHQHHDVQPKFKEIPDMELPRDMTVATLMVQGKLRIIKTLDEIESLLDDMNDADLDSLKTEMEWIKNTLRKETEKTVEKRPDRTAGRLGRVLQISVDEQLIIDSCSEGRLSTADIIRAIVWRRETAKQVELDDSKWFPFAF